MTDSSRPNPILMTGKRWGGRRQLGAAGAAVTGAGAALVATASTACCAGPVVAPLVVAVLGAGGAAWAAGLEPYSRWLLGGAALLLAYAFWSVYTVRAACDVPPAARRRFEGVAVKSVLWIAATLWLAALAVHLFPAR